MEKKKYTAQLVQFGKRLRELRKQKGLTQLDLEVATGIYAPEISKIENGLKNIEFITIAKFAEALSVDLHELFLSDGTQELRKTSSKRKSS